MKSPVVLLLVDFINDFEFEGGERLYPMALAAARATAELRRRAKRNGVAVVYCNDNFGKWRSDFKQLLNHCLNEPEPDNRTALEHMAKVCKARVLSSAELDIAQLLK